MFWVFNVENSQIVPQCIHVLWLITIYLSPNDTSEVFNSLQVWRLACHDRVLWSSINTVIDMAWIVHWITQSLELENIVGAEEIIFFQDNLVHGSLYL